MSGQRDVFYHPAPIYDMPGFGLDALPKSFTVPKEVVVAKSGDFTSDAIAHGTNGFDVIAVFTTATSVKVEILDADDSDKVLATYTLTPLAAVGHFTFYDVRLNVCEHPNLKFRLSSIAGGGTVALNLLKTA